VTSAPEPQQPETPSDPWAWPAAPPEPYRPEPHISGPFPPVSQPPVQPQAPPQPQSGVPYSGAPYSSPPTMSHALVAQPGPVIVQIGEIAVTSTVVRTPAGDIPLAGSTWTVADYWHNEQKIPTWAIVCAVLGFCVLTVFSLLFLLAKETVYRGTAQITVTNGTRQYVARIPVTDQTQVAYLHQQVNYVRSLAAL
jgi:hypothetical protein